MAQTKIMVVEDEPITALDIRKQLKNLGYAVPAMAALGEEAVSKAANTRPDLVLMDINLKGEIDGITAAEQLRSRFSIPVIFLTAYSDEATLQRARAVEPSGYLLKPFDTDTLRSTIELALYRRRTEQKLTAIYRLGQELTLLYDEKVIIQKVLTTALTTLYFEWAGGGVIDEATGEIKYYHHVGGDSAKVTELRLPLDDDRQIATAVIHSGQAINIADIKRDGRYVAWAMGWNGRSELCVPMKVGQRIIGVLNVASSQVHQFTLADQQLLQTLADQAAVVLENARLYRAEREQFEQLQKSQAQLIQMEKMAALGRLVASIAHEINNPIQALQNALTLVREGVAGQLQPDKLNLYLDITESEVQRIATIVRRMRDFYHLARRKQQLSAESADEFYSLADDDLQAVNPQELLESVLHLVKQQFQQRLIEIDYIPFQEPTAVQGNPDHLKQVFLNLVLNAMDAMADQGGKFTVRLWQEKFDRPGEQAWPVLKIEFSDTGPGIPPDSLPRIFEPFFTTKEWGWGFGLFTSYKIIEAHHGQIEVKSYPGSGSTFTLTLPLILTAKP